jgi:GST-like protein
MIKFYSHHTPNPMKIALFLEEAALPYEVIPVDTLKGEQHEPAFRAINPNAKLPAIIDDGVAVFDSNAILLYLADKHRRFLGSSAERGALLSWLMFVATGIGPYCGQAFHFQHMAPEKLPYAINRYGREVARHYKILDERLASQYYIAGPEYTIVDMAAWGWLRLADPLLGKNALDVYPNLKRWFSGVNSRPAAARAERIKETLSFKTTLDEAALRALFPSNYADA